MQFGKLQFSKYRKVYAYAAMSGARADLNTLPFWRFSWVSLYYDLLRYTKSVLLVNVAATLRGWVPEMQLLSPLLDQTVPCSAAVLYILWRSLRVFLVTFVPEEKNVKLIACNFTI